MPFWICGAIRSGFENVCGIEDRLAIANGNLKLGALINHLDNSGLDEILEQYLALNELYDEVAS